MYVCIDQNCGVTTEGGEEEEANISLLFLPFTRREREEATIWTDIFLSFTTKKKEREREGTESKVKVI
jgi:hypothetical protein